VAHTAQVIHEALGRMRHLLPSKQYVKVPGSILAPPQSRWCGAEFKDDTFYVKSAEGEAHRLMNGLQCTNTSRVLDVGCGQGRLPIGILRVIGEMNYLGLDVHQPSIEWCKRYIERDYPSFQFTHINVYNERYNKHGRKLERGFRFALEPESVDLVYLFSVFSHTTDEDIRVYLKDFARILASKGKIFFTTFVEEDVPNMSINPENYRAACSGPLHIVRYNKSYLFSLLDEAGYAILDFAHGTEIDGQSAIYLRKKHG
jgi:SAM-dependent methyltransferase